LSKLSRRHASLSLLSKPILRDSTRLLILETESQQSRLELGCVSAADSDGRTIWIADAHRDGSNVELDGHGDIIATS